MPSNFYEGDWGNPPVALISTIPNIEWHRSKAHPYRMGATPYPAYDRLSTQRKLFVDAYLGRWNAYAAARAAGYKQPYSQGPRLLGIVEIKEAIEERLVQHHMSANEVLARLSDQARGSLEDFIRFGFREDKDGKVSLTLTYAVDLKKARRLGKLHLLKSWKASTATQGEKIELYSAQDALKTVAQVHQLLADKSRANFEDMLEALIAKLAARLPPDILEQVLTVIAQEDGGGSSSRG